MSASAITLQDSPGMELCWSFRRRSIKVEAVVQGAGLRQKMAAICCPVRGNMYSLHERSVSGRLPQGRCARSWPFAPVPTSKSGHQIQRNRSFTDLEGLRELRDRTTAGKKVIAIGHARVYLAVRALRPSKSECIEAMPLPMIVRQARIRAVSFSALCVTIHNSPCSSSTGGEMRRSSGFGSAR